jgi:transglutaminase-like putative cysteine protease
MIKPAKVIDYLLYLIVFIAFIPLIGEVGIGYELLFVSLIVYSVFSKVTVPRLLLNILSVSIVLLTVSHMSIDYMVIPALQSLMFITSIKFIEENRTSRDYMQIYVLAIFMLAGSALINLSIWFILYALLIFFLVSVSMILLTFVSEDREIELSHTAVKTIIIKTLAIPALTIPAAILLFAILPRTNYPVFDYLNREDGLSTGFSESVSLGNVSDIQQDSRLIFRAETPEQKGAPIYWRGVVMDNFDGMTWSISGNASERTRIAQPAKMTEQTIYLEAYGDRYLFGLDTPYHITLRGSGRGTGFVHSLEHSVQRRVKYTAYSSSDKYLFEEYSNYDRFLQLPQLSVELQAFIDSFEDMPAEKLADYMQVYFIRNKFQYSITKLPVSGTPLEDFLLRTRLGNCEYFASATAVVLRSKGVPARLVGGFFGGYYNETGGYYAVPQRNAHIWVEAYIDGKGWVRVESTPVASLDFVANDKDFFLKVRMITDLVSFYYNAFVINYDFTKQMLVVKNISNSMRELKNDYKALVFKAMKMFPYFLAILLGLLAYKFMKGIRLNDDSRYASKLRGLLNKKGYASAENLGLTEIKITDEKLKHYADEYISIFHSAYYRGRKLTKEEKQRLSLLLGKMRKHGSKNG